MAGRFAPAQWSRFEFGGFFWKCYQCGSHAMEPNSCSGITEQVSYSKVAGNGMVQSSENLSDHNQLHIS